MEPLSPSARRYLVGHVRRAWRYYSQARKECLRSKECISCKSKTRRLYADHVDPVGHFDETKNPYVVKMFCDRAGLQPMCKQCHLKKTREERAERKKKK